ncbi:hypothetical protein RRG08_007822 [Elysia crispata]|uniref:Uncharacterized protein n=1 Tax=Elysia crispata TaxID=231223 RepID=A0AAE1AF45_9GAST|nr:hypothetical protein RRG08_007822 [Elysia crispata]
MGRYQLQLRCKHHGQNFLVMGRYQLQLRCKDHGQNFLVMGRYQIQLRCKDHGHNFLVMGRYQIQLRCKDLGQNFLVMGRYQIQLRCKDLGQNFLVMGRYQIQLRCAYEKEVLVASKCIKCMTDQSQPREICVLHRRRMCSQFLHVGADISWNFLVAPMLSLTTDSLLNTLYISDRSAKSNGRSIEPSGKLIFRAEVKGSSSGPRI